MDIFFSGDPTGEEAWKGDEADGEAIRAPCRDEREPKIAPPAFRFYAARTYSGAP